MFTPIRKSSSNTVVIGPFWSATSYTVLNGLNISNTDIKVSKAGAAEVDKNSGGATGIGSGKYSIVLDETDCDTVGELSVSVVMSGALPYSKSFQVLEEVAFDNVYAVGADGGSSIGKGAIQHTCSVLFDNEPLPGADVWITTDQDGDNVVAGVVVTDASGAAKFWLDPGTYYQWTQKSTFEFESPIQITVA
jgi:hypothetical protein